MTQKELNKILSNLTEEEAHVYNHLGNSYENRSSKRFVCSMTGYSTRKFRDLVRSLRFKGLPVCSQVSNGGGYWLEWNKKEFGKFVFQQKTEVEGYQKSLNKLIEIYKSLKGKDPNELFI